MWTVFRRQWDYYVISFLLELYVAAPIAVVIILLLTLPVAF